MKTRKQYAKERHARNKETEKKVNDFVKSFFLDNPKMTTMTIIVTEKRSKYRKGKKGLKSSGLFFKRQEFVKNKKEVKKHE